MANLIEMFGFEQRSFPLGDTIFRPLKDALDRWGCQIYGGYRAAGLSFRVLYELPDCRFVLFDYHCCEKRTVRHWWWNREIWVGSDPPKYRELTPDRAVEFLWECHCELPKSLEHWPEKMLREKANQPDPPRPTLRPLSLWAGTRSVGRHYKSPPDDVLTYVDELIKMGVLAVQELRKWDIETTPIPFYVECFMAMLMATFKVDLATWKCSVDTIPPESVTLLGLPWPAKTHQIQECIRHLIELLDPPVVVLKGFRPSKNAEEPTWEEQKAASKALRDAIPDMEMQIVSMRKRLAEIRQNQEQEAKAQAERLAVEEPSKDAFLVYRMYRISGLTQEQVAVEYQRTRGISISQPTVSRMIKQVEGWLKVENLLPSNEAPNPGKAVPVDPQTLDRGPRQDGQTPAQRGKGDPE